MTARPGSLRLPRLFVAVGALSFSMVLIAGAGIALAGDAIPAEDAAVLTEQEVGEPTTAPTLTKEDALAMATEVYGEDVMGATKVKAYLVSATPEIALRTPRPTWVVHMSGMGMVMAGPAPEEGTQAATNVVDDIYVYIDAKTGEFLMGIWTK